MFICLLMDMLKIFNEIGSFTMNASAVRKQSQVKWAPRNRPIDHLERTKPGASVLCIVMSKLRLMKLSIPRLDVISNKASN